MIFVPLFYAKIVRAEGKGSLLTLLRRSLSYAKIVQTEYRESLLSILRCSLFYVKIVQTEGYSIMFEWPSGRLLNEKEKLYK